MANRVCSECPASLAGKAPQTKTCSKACRDKRYRRMKAARVRGGKATALPPHQKVLQQIVRGERDDAARQVIHDELRRGLVTTAPRANNKGETMTDTTTSTDESFSRALATAIDRDTEPFDLAEATPPETVEAIGSRFQDVLEHVRPYPEETDGPEWDEWSKQQHEIAARVGDYVLEVAWRYSGKQR